VPGDGGGAVSSGSGGKLVLIDSGFSQYSSFGTHGINYALLVKNTSSDSTFDQAEVTISFLNKAGTSVASDDTFLDPIPAGKVGALVSDVLDVPAGAKANRMVVELSDPLDWISQPGEISGKVVSVNASNSYGTYEVKTTALFTSTFLGQEKDVSVYAVYRNAGGKIIGGVQDYVNVVPASGKANHVFDDLPNVGGVKRVEVYAAASNIG
jgi:hypothetical protein